MEMQWETKVTFSGQVKTVGIDRGMQWKTGFVHFDSDADSNSWIARMYLKANPKQIYHQIKIAASEACDMNVKCSRLMIENKKGAGIHLKLSGSDIENAKKIIKKIQTHDTPRKVSKAEVSVASRGSHSSSKRIDVENVSPSPCRRGVVGNGTHQASTKSPYSASQQPSSKRRLDISYPDSGSNDTLTNGVADKDETWKSHRFTGMKDYSRKSSYNMNPLSFYGSPTQPPNFLEPSPRRPCAYQSVGSKLNRDSNCSRSQSPCVKKAKLFSWSRTGDEGKIMVATPCNDSDEGCSANNSSSSIGNGNNNNNTSTSSSNCMSKNTADSTNVASVIPTRSGLESEARKRPYSHSRTVGFENLGNSCFMNSPLQCLSYLEPFSLDVQAATVLYGSRLGQNAITRILYLLMKDIRKSDTCPRRVKDILVQLRDDINGKFAMNTQQDAHELLNELLNRTHDEVKNVVQNPKSGTPKDVKEDDMTAIENMALSPLPPTPSPPPPPPSSPPPLSPPPPPLTPPSLPPLPSPPADTSQPQQTIPELVSPIDTNFTWFFKESSECKTCHTHTPFRHGQDTILILPIDSRSDSHVQDCVDKYFGSNELERECETCGKTEASISTRKITQRPRIFILMLLRYQHMENMESKKMDRIHIPRYLSIDDFCAEDVKPPPYIDPIFMLDRESDTTSRLSPDNSSSKAEAVSSISSFKTALDYATVIASCSQRERLLYVGDIKSQEDVSLNEEGRDEAEMEGASGGHDYATGSTSPAARTSSVEGNLDSAENESGSLDLATAVEQIMEALSICDRVVSSWKVIQECGRSELTLLTKIRFRAQNTLVRLNDDCNHITCTELDCDDSLEVVRHNNAQPRDALRDCLAQCYQRKNCSLMSNMLVAELLQDDLGKERESDEDIIMQAAITELLCSRYSDVEEADRLDFLVQDLAIVLASRKLGSPGKASVDQSSRKDGMDGPGKSTREQVYNWLRGQEIQVSEPRSKRPMDSFGEPSSPVSELRDSDPPFGNSDPLCNEVFEDFEDQGSGRSNKGGLKKQSHNRTEGSGSKPFNRAPGEPIDKLDDFESSVEENQHKYKRKTLKVADGGAMKASDPLSLGKCLNDYLEEELYDVDPSNLSEDDQMVYAMALSRFDQQRSTCENGDDTNVSGVSEKGGGNKHSSMDFLDPMNDGDFMEICEPSLDEENSSEYLLEGKEHSLPDGPGSSEKKSGSIQPSSSNSIDAERSENNGSTLDAMGKAVASLTPSTSSSSEHLLGNTQGSNSKSQQELCLPDIRCDENLSDLDEPAFDLGTKTSENSTDVIDKALAQVLKASPPSMTHLLDGPVVATPEVSENVVMEYCLICNSSYPYGHVCECKPDFEQPRDVFPSEHVLMKMREHAKTPRELEIASILSIACSDQRKDVPLRNQGEENDEQAISVSAKTFADKPLHVSPDVKDHVVPSVSPITSPKKDVYQPSTSKNNNLVKTKDYSRLRSPSASPKKRIKSQNGASLLRKSSCLDSEKSAKKALRLSVSDLDSMGEEEPLKSSDFGFESASALSVDVNLDETSFNERKQNQLFSPSLSPRLADGTDMMSPPVQFPSSAIDTKLPPPSPRHGDAGRLEHNMSSTPRPVSFSRPLLSDSASQLKSTCKSDQSDPTSHASKPSKILAIESTHENVMGPPPLLPNKAKVTRSLTGCFGSPEEKENTSQESRSRRKRLDTIETGQTPCSYRLMGVVNHLGESLNGGHYISYCYNLHKQRWFHMDDKDTRETLETTARRESLTSGYVFFYMDKDLFDAYEDRASKVPT